MNQENLGAAERIINSVLAYTDHAVHNRPGIVSPDLRTTIGVRWEYASYKKEGTEKVAYKISRLGKKSIKTRVGVIGDDGKVREGNSIIGEWRDPGLFPEVVAWMYQQVADIYRLDHEFAAKWASYQFTQEHRDLKVILAAFMIVQSRKGDPIVENGKVSFYDEDYRDVGEAMMLIYKKDTGLTPKLLLRIRDVLELPAIAEINRKLGFTRSARNPEIGRWRRVVHKWLLYREENPKLLEGLVKAGFQNTVKTLCRRSNYKPETTKFFKTLRWKQHQAKDGHRTMAIGEAVEAAVNWDDLNEQQICERIVKEKVGWKRLVSLVPGKVGLTRAIMAAAIESGSLSDKDLIIATPTIEELGLMDVQEVKIRWEGAVRKADDMRAANIATRVKSTKVKEKLEEAADNALKNATEEVMKGMRVYVFIDRSGSMQNAIEAAIRMLTKMLPAFPEDRVHVVHFNTSGTEMKFKARSAAGVANAFRGVVANGGTDYGAAIRTVWDYKPKDDEDVLFIFVGDEEASAFTQVVTNSKLRPMAFGFLRTQGQHGNGRAVRDTAAALGIPCFLINEETFSDTYAIPRTIRNLVAVTPVGKAEERAVAPRRATLVDTILKTTLLQKPVWAS